MTQAEVHTSMSRGPWETGVLATISSESTGPAAATLPLSQVASEKALPGSTPVHPGGPMNVCGPAIIQVESKLTDSLFMSIPNLCKQFS